MTFHIEELVNLNSGRTKCHHKTLNGINEECLVLLEVLMIICRLLVKNKSSETNEHSP